MRHVETNRCLTRLGLSLLLVVPLLAGARSSEAIGVSILDVTSSAGDGELSLGDTLTLDLGLTNDFGEVYGVGISVYGYDRDVVEFVQLETVSSFLNESIAPDGSPAGGFVNHVTQIDYSIWPDEIAEILYRTSEPKVEVWQGISLLPISGDGSLDRGIGGERIEEGGAHARVTFRLVGPGVTILSIGTDPATDAIVFDKGRVTTARGAELAVSAGMGTRVEAALAITPEPGPALLIGLGLAALSIKRPRHSQA